MQTCSRILWFTCGNEQFKGGFVIIEIPSFVALEDVSVIRNSVSAFLPKASFPVYNRDGKTVAITETPELKSTDTLISKIMQGVLDNVILRRYKPAFASGDSGYEYHLYQPGEVCHYHTDGEVCKNQLRYATVIIFLTDNDDGELVFPAQNKEIKPEAGKIVVVPPNGRHGHYTKPAKADREILMTWFVYSGLQVTEK